MSGDQRQTMPVDREKKLIYFLIIIFLILQSCSISRKENITATVEFTASGYHQPEPTKPVKFTQTIEKDSLFRIKYIYTTKDRIDTNKTYYHFYHEFQLVADTSIHYQKIILKDSLINELWLTNFKTYSINETKYDVYKFLNNVTIHDYCVNFYAYYWCPYFGVIIWRYGSDSHGRPGKILTKSHNPEYDKTLNNLIDSILNDKDFYLYKGATKDFELMEKNELQKACAPYTPQIDNPWVIDSLRTFVQANTEYPEIKNKCMSGNFYTDIKIDETGKVEHGLYSYSSEKVFYTNYEDFQKECLRVLDEITAWEPTVYLGKEIWSYNKLTFHFIIPDSSICKDEFRKRAKQLEQERANQVYTMVEDMPKFSGGEQALTQYLKNEIIYPEKAKQSGISGRIHVKFIIDKEGKISNIKIIRAFESDWKEEFIRETFRLIENMPKWRPGRQRGETMNVEKSLLIEFNPDNE